MSVQHPTWVDVATQELDYWQDPRWLALSEDDRSDGIDRYAAWLEAEADGEAPTEELVDRIRLDSTQNDKTWAIVSGLTGLMSGDRSLVEAVEPALRDVTDRLTAARLPGESWADVTRRLKGEATR